MKIKIYENTVIGTLCYSEDAISKLQRYQYLIATLIEINNLRLDYYIDSCNYKIYMRLHGSITNMLRFRTSLKCCLNLIEI
jgi:hypothetical protein